MSGHIGSFPGPFFKCDFCGLNVTDRVSHMKVEHYSPLAQVMILFTIKTKGDKLIAKILGVQKAKWVVRVPAV